MSKKNIIAISGTQGTGKSYTAYKLCTFLRKQGYNVVVIDELARETNLPINKEADDTTQVSLISGQINKELEKSQKYDFVVVDRSVFDAYCYGLYLDKKEEWTFKYLKTFLTHHVNKHYYKLYLLDPVSFNYNIEDGVRDTDEAFRNSIHELLFNTLKETNVPFQLIQDDFEIFSDFYNIKKNK